MATFSAFDPTQGEDGLPIVVREPRQSWKANVFWGLVLGLPAIVLPWLAGEEAMWIEKAGTTLVALGWIAFMGASAWRNFGRTVRCDMEAITVTQACRPHRVPLSEIAGITREDVRESLRKFDEIGVSRYKTKPLDTMAPIVMHVMRDASGRTLLRLDDDMEPGPEFRKLLARVRRAIERRPPRIGAKESP